MAKKMNNTFKYLFYLIILFTTTTFVYYRGQDLNWDLLNYHYYSGYSLLNGRNSDDIAAANLQSFLNPITNLLSYVSLKFLPFPLSAWIILGVQLTCIPAIILLANEISTGLGYTKKFTTLFPAISISLISPLWWSELGTTFSSALTAPLVIFGIYFIYGSLEIKSYSVKRVIIAGILFGLAVGLKLTNAIFTLSGFLMIIVLFYGSTWRTWTSAYINFIFACILGFLLTSWWNWYLWTAWGSPIFPLYNNLFKSDFFDHINFRDIRWHFATLQEFLIYTVQSVWGTSKTSEIAFADASYLILIVLLPAAILCRPSLILNRQLVAFIFFMMMALFMWAGIFAYQRYLIPFELLKGLLIWILVVRIVESALLRTAIMIGLSVCMLLLLKVPDWGHRAINFGEKNPFSIQMDKRIYSTPARYLVVGNPISYILPYLHPGSIFYGVGFSNQVNDLIFENLTKSSTLPLRILAKDSDEKLISYYLKNIDYNPLQQSLDCTYFTTVIGRYTVCELKYNLDQSTKTNSSVYLDFTKNAIFKKNNGIKWEQGLSSFEVWGRWSDKDRVEFGLSNCLPQGRLNFVMVGHAFGPNAGLPVKIVLGDKEIVTEFSATTTQQIVPFTNDEKCIDKFFIKIPKPTSPHELGLSQDTRRLGLAFVTLEIFKE
jgi:hypothetical protein